MLFLPHTKGHVGRYRVQFSFELHEPVLNYICTVILWPRVSAHAHTFQVGEGEEGVS